ncbi:hypothetical protein [Desulfobulbus elongatus]|uniref:hypothetical protein n=1 Tax=Desulfobulbus elongatus TaxID=53332 RepID=UPI0012FB7A39|nr:hypothetical protein [Desulfobulbus elongatus]
MELMLRKLGFSGGEIAAMPVGEARGWLEAQAELMRPPGKRRKKFRVLQQDKNNG